MIEFDLVNNHVKFSYMNPPFVRYKRYPTGLLYEHPIATSDIEWVPFQQNKVRNLELNSSQYCNCSAW